MVAATRSKSKNRSRSRETSKGFKGPERKKEDRSNAGIQAQTGLTIRNPYKKKLKSNKAVSFKNRPVVKVSRDFRKKVDKVLEAAKNYGRWCQHEFGYIVNNIRMNQQTVGHINSGTFSNWDFLPETFLHCASVLWNNKPDSQASRTWDNSNNLGANNANMGQVSGKPNDLANNAKFDVKFSKVCYNLKNNSQITRSIEIILCSPKTPTTRELTTGSAEFGGSYQVNDEMVDPEYFWTRCLITAAQTGQNISGITPSYLGTRPYHLAAWNRYFSYESTQIVLEPGQTFCYEVKGPSFDFDMTKYWKNTLLMSVQKYCRWPMFIMQGEMLQGATTETKIGYTVGAPKTGYGEVILHRKFECGLTMPEMAGVAIKAGGSLVAGQLQLNNRKPAFGCYNYGDTTEFLVSFKVDETNPNIVTTDAG